MKNTIQFLFFVVLGAICLMFHAFYNGFPIVYSDTSTYIASGFELETPFDRPITYSLFLRLFSLNGFSLWFVIFFQGLILSYLLFLIIKMITNEKTYLYFGLLCIILLSLFTGVSWTVSQLMPDIFTAIALLCITLILLGSFNRSTSIVLHIIFLIAVAMHMSHVLLFALLLVITLSLSKFILPKQEYPKQNLQITLLLLLTIASIVTMGSAISKSKHVFFMGAMVEHGITQHYLNDNCHTKQYKLCAYKDSLPDRAYKFVWDEKSPFYKIGGWKETKNEFNAIIYGTLTQPKYILLHIKESVKATLQQLTLFSIGDGNGSFMEETLLHKRIATYFPNDLKAYSYSKQNQAKLTFLPFTNRLLSAVMIFSLLLFIYLLAKFKPYLNKQFKITAILFLIGILLNAWDCGTFANAIDRFGCKIMWLIPFTTLIFYWKIRNTTNEK